MAAVHAGLITRDEGTRKLAGSAHPNTDVIERFAWGTYTGTETAYMHGEN